MEKGLRVVAVGWPVTRWAEKAAGEEWGGTDVLSLLEERLGDAANDWLNGLGAKILAKEVKPGTQHLLDICIANIEDGSQAFSPASRVSDDH